MRRSHAEAATTRCTAPAVAALMLATGCDAPLSTFSTASGAAARVTWLAWFMTILSAVIFVAVMATMLVAVRRNRRRDPAGVDLAERGPAWLIWGGAAMPAVVLLAIFVVAAAAMRRAPGGTPAVTIHVTGHQWWWALDYDFGRGEPRFTTANELHIPVGQPVRLLLTSADVIHSFWVPRLQGKLDLIPGDTNEMRLDARRPGRYAGACGEYCGAQHAHMLITVIAEDSAAFRAWAASEAAMAAPPSDSLARRGAHLFATGACIGCHTIRGTSAVGTIGPDLTHVGARHTLAAGTLPNSLGALAGWIGNPQALKPGTLMPTLRDYTGPDLRALAAYMSHLR